MITEAALVKAVREFLAGTLPELALRRLAHEALADHIGSPQTGVGRLAIEVASRCSERYDDALSDAEFRSQLGDLLPTRTLEIRLPASYSSSQAVGATSAELTQSEYRVCAAE